VPAKPAGIWHLALESLKEAEGHLLRFRILESDANGDPLRDKWHASATVECTADGVNGPARTGMLVGTAPRGALVGKLGGSTADLPDSTNPATPYGTKKVFAIGTTCIMSLASGEGTALFLTMNDSPEGFAEHTESLHVVIEKSS
jgi:hypothetical protein